MKLAELPKTTSTRHCGWGKMRAQLMLALKIAGRKRFRRARIAEGFGVGFWAQNRASRGELARCEYNGCIREWVLINTHELPVRERVD